MAAISIRGLAKTYASGTETQAALSALDLEIADNTFVTLLGPSGCGKTTTLRLIAGYLKPDAGTIHIGGRLLSSSTQVVSPENRGMGMVFQNYAVWPHKTVYDNIAFGLKLRRVPKPEMERRIGTALDNVNLGGLERRYPSELSGGQQQRVALARSLVVEPDILLLDEPLSNLDAKLRERMRGELKQLQRRTGITFIYVTHDQAEALALSDQIAVMHGGKLQQYGTPFDVYARPVNRTVADFMGLVNIVQGRIVGSPPAIEIAGTQVPHAGLPAWTMPGGLVDIAIRPENIRLDREEQGRAGMAGSIVDRTFLGNITEYLVDVPGLPTLRVQTHPLQLFDTGQPVRVELDLDTSSIFPAAREEPAQRAA